MKIRLLAAALLCTVTVLKPAFAEEAMDPQRLFDEAIQLRNGGDLFGAMEIFETILSRQPGLSRARLELAVAYRQARRYQEAREQLQKVLDNKDTPAAVKLSITAYLAQLSSDEKSIAKRNSSSIYVSAGLFTDSNVNLGPTEIQNPDSNTVTDINGTGSVVMLSYSHRSRASQPITMGKTQVNMEWHSQLLSYNKMHTGKENRFNLNVLSLTTGPALIADKNWRTALNIKIDKIYFAANPYAFYVGLNPLFTLIFDKQMEVTFESRITKREFSTTAGKSLQGTDKMYGISATKFYSKSGIGVEAGVRYYDNGAEDVVLQAKGVSVYLGGQMGIWKGGRAYFRASTRKYDYQGIDTVRGFTVARDDTELKMLLGVSHRFTAGVMKSWTANAQYAYTDNSSNTSEAALQALDYKRNVFEMNLRRYF